MNIRPVQTKDAAEWLRMRLALDPTADPVKEENEISRFVAGPPRSIPTLQAVFVSDRADGTLCGFVEASIRPYADGCETNDVGYLEAWYVDRDMRRSGIGSSPVETAENWAREQGCQEMASDSDIFNIISHAAHQNLGFSEVGRIVQYCKKLD